MPDRNPRTIDVRVRKCPNCGRLSDGRYTSGLCDCDDASESEFERIVFVEKLGPERMLAWAIDQLGEDAVAELLLDAMAEERGRDVSYTAEAEVHLALGRLVRALRGSGDGE